MYVDTNNMLGIRDKTPLKTICCIHKFLENLGFFCITISATAKATSLPDGFIENPIQCSH